MIYHTGLGVLPGGYVGVDVFFVISGYLIAGMLSREVSETGTISLTSFYARRARRLIPAAVFVIVITVVIANSLYSPLEFKPFSSTAIASITYLSNFWFAHLATDYLAGGTEANPLLHTWSLSVEEQFYIIWPFLLLAAHKLGRAYSSQQSGIIPIIVLSVLSLVLSLWLTSYAQPWAFFSCVTRMWEFGAGALIALLPRSTGYRYSGLLNRFGSTFGLVLIILPAFLFSKHTTFPGYAALAPVIGTALAIYFLDAQQTGFLEAALSSRLARFLGDISYSLYLWHWPVFVFLEEYSAIGSVLEKITGIIISIVLATATYYLIENPFRFSKLSASTNLRSYTTGLILIIAAVAICYDLREDARIGIELPDQQRYALAKKTRPGLYDDNCHYDQLDVKINDCEYGNKHATDTMVLLGDSHAAHWFPAVELIAREKHLRLVPFTKSSCPTADFEPMNHNLGRMYSECTTWRENVFDAVAALQPKYILISNYANYKRDKTGAKEWADAQRRSLMRLSESGAEIIIINDIPPLNFDPAKCLSRASWQKKSTAESCRVVLDGGPYELIAQVDGQLAETSAQIKTINLNHYICRDRSCPVERDGLIIYSDKNHLSVDFAKSLASRLKSELSLN